MVHCNLSTGTSSINNKCPHSSKVRWSRFRIIPFNIPGTFYMLLEHGSIFLENSSKGKCTTNSWFTRKPYLSAHQFNQTFCNT
uniref:HK3a n=1 Tax=Arundo donax TaxID=35708 RepID=A0A0A9D0X5_ARUDO